MTIIAGAVAADPDSLLCDGIRIEDDVSAIRVADFAHSKANWNPPLPSLGY